MRVVPNYEKRAGRATRLDLAITHIRNHRKQLEKQIGDLKTLERQLLTKYRP